MRHRTTFVLMVLFLSGLGVLWWVDYAEIPTREKQRILLNRLLPGLVDVSPAEVRKIEVDRGAGKPRIVAIRGEEGRWQMTEPIDAAADPTLIETLVGNLKTLRKSPDAGTIKDDPAPYGLEKPAYTVHVFGKDGHTPLATLEVGKQVRGRVYVRPDGDPGIEIADARLLSALDMEPAGWRDTALFRVPSFRVSSVSIESNSPSNKEIRLERADRAWRLTRPIQAPADNDRAEGLVAELSALRAEDFVEDDLRDKAKYGFDRPSKILKLTPFSDAGTPQTLILGKDVPGTPGHVYAMRGDQNDVVRVDTRRLNQALPGVNGLRSQNVVDLNPQRVDRIQVDTQGKVFDLRKRREGWELLTPVREAADRMTVQLLVTKLAEMKASEFLEPSNVPSPMPDPPTFRVRAWQSEPASANSKGEETTRAPRVDLKLGRHDAIKKTVFGQLAGDTTLLALPDSILDVLPRNALSFRDRTLLTIRPEQFESLTVERDGTIAKVRAPGPKDPPGRWKMVAPVNAPADNEAITGLVLTLGNLRAEHWESETLDDGKAFGLDRPRVRIRWTTQPGSASASTETTSGGTLRIGKRKPGSTAFYANLEGDPKVFSLNAAVVVPLDAELHDRTVLAFKPETLERIVLRWPARSLMLEKVERPGVPPGTWQVAENYEASGFDVSKISAFVTTLSDLKASRFVQYNGPIPGSTGLASPRLSVSLRFKAGTPPRTLRVGDLESNGSSLATIADGNTGPVFLLPTNAAWTGLISPPRRLDDLPDDVFTPGNGASHPESPAMDILRTAPGSVPPGR